MAGQPLLREALRKSAIDLRSRVLLSKRSSGLVGGVETAAPQGVPIARAPTDNVLALDDHRRSCVTARFLEDQQRADLAVILLT